MGASPPRLAFVRRGSATPRCSSRIDGVRVLTDPVFGERVSPVSWAGPRALSSPARHGRRAPAPRRGRRLARSLRPPRLPDHRRARTPRDALLHVARRRCAPRGVGRRALADHRARLVGRGRAAGRPPLLHRDARPPLLRARHRANRTAWSSWVMRGANHRVFFSGDTGLTPEFETIRERCGPFDLVMLEVGAYHPAWGEIHLGPDNALVAHRMLGGGALLPVHWGTFDLGLHPWDEPIETLTTAAQAARRAPAHAAARPRNRARAHRGDRPVVARPERARSRQEQLRNRRARGVRFDSRRLHHVATRIDFASLLTGDLKRATSTEPAASSAPERLCTSFSLLARTAQELAMQGEPRARLHTPRMRTTVGN